MTERSERVPRTRVPEVVKSQPSSLSREEQLARLQYWTTFIANLHTGQGMSLRERWEEADKKVIAERDIRMGWKGKKGS